MNLVRRIPMLVVGIVLAATAVGVVGVPSVPAAAAPAPPAGGSSLPIRTYSSGLETGAQPLSIATGSDGNLWFTDAGTSKALGRITPAGVITEFSNGLNPGSIPETVVAGPAQTLWFIDAGTTRAIGRITTAGVITEFSDELDPGSLPTSLIVDPNGNVWFADQGTTPAIGRITPAGVITEYSAGLDAGAQPVNLVSGPDGNLWFTDRGTTPALGRSPLTGRSPSSRRARPGSQPFAIAGGPGGDVWFTDEGTTKAVGRVSARPGDHRILGRAQRGERPLRPGGRTERQPVVHRRRRHSRHRRAVAHRLVHPVLGRAERRDPQVPHRRADANLSFTADTTSTVGWITPTGTVTLLATGAAPAVRGGAGTTPPTPPRSGGAGLGARRQRLVHPAVRGVARHRGRGAPDRVSPVASDGGIFTFGSATFAGSMGGHPLNRPVVGMAEDPVPAGTGRWPPTGRLQFQRPLFGSEGGTARGSRRRCDRHTRWTGYWEVASNGAVYAFGDAANLGSMAGFPLNAPIVGMAVDTTTGGYWEAASDGGIRLRGPLPRIDGRPSSQSAVVGMASDWSTGGYWEVASDGGIFAFGAPFLGSTGGSHLNRPVVGMAPTADPRDTGRWPRTAGSSPSEEQPCSPGPWGAPPSTPRWSGPGWFPPPPSGPPPYRASA